MSDGPVRVRRYERRDEEPWLRCRALSFLSSSYFDDVLTSKPTLPGTAIELVAEVGGVLAGVMDVAVDGSVATIETVATHPDHRRLGLATVLLDHAVAAIDGPTVLDAWTRDDEAANRWYQANGFVETYRYLHVYASTDDEIDAAVTETAHDLRPVRGFFHAEVGDEPHLRERFARVHTCRRYERPL